MRGVCLRKQQLAEVLFLISISANSFAENQLGCLNSGFDSASCRRASASGTRFKKQKLARCLIAA
jgi:hypothetical protein